MQSEANLSPEAVRNIHKLTYLEFYGTEENIAFQVSNNEVEEYEREEQLAISYKMLGKIYFDYKLVDKSLKAYAEALKLFIFLEDHQEISACSKIISILQQYKQTHLLSQTAFFPEIIGPAKH